MLLDVIRVSLAKIDDWGRVDSERLTCSRVSTVSELFLACAGLRVSVRVAYLIEAVQRLRRSRTGLLCWHEAFSSPPGFDLGVAPARTSCVGKSMAGGVRMLLPLPPPTS